MGQGSSSPSRRAQQSSQSPEGDSRQRWPTHSSLVNFMRNTETQTQPGNAEDAGTLLTNNEANDNDQRPTHSSNVYRLTQFTTIPPRRSALQRSRSTISNLLSRREPSSEPRMSHRRTSYMRSSSNNAPEPTQSVFPPRLPSIDQTSTFDRDIFSWSDDTPSRPQVPPHRRANIRFNPLRPDRPFRHFTSSLRRRRSPLPATLRRATGGAEDQAVLLSQLLSAAAAATAATLMGDNHQALSEARSLSVGTGIGELNGSGEDGTFEGFLRALQSGRIASALRQTGNEAESSESASREGPPLNFFRMFRFGSPTTPVPDASNENDDSESEGRMVPIIIVGIRSISPSTSNSPDGGNTSPDELPPFLDALTNFAAPARESEDLDPLGHSSIDSILRPPQNGTSFRHRRRASVHGYGMGRSRINDRYDDQRDHRSPDRRRPRPWSMASSSSTEPRPPPATPASPSPELSRISSRNSSPPRSRPASYIANSLRDVNGESRRNSALHRSVSSPLASHTEENTSVHSTNSSDNLIQQAAREHDSPWSADRRSDNSANVHYPRFASGHPRRNGVVEPDHLPTLSRPSTGAASASNTDATRSANDSRSWIIYVLGGSYPETHPILTTPSLFSDNPTYEDMMLLSALLGPAKAPVASDEDVQSAGGLYNIALADPAITPEADSTSTTTGATEPKLSGLIAIATADTDTENNPERIALEAEHRCLVCLCDFEINETMRRLGKCGHLFHKECIDHWLTQGRNSCPLCRGEGVEEKSKPESASTETSGNSEVFAPVPTGSAV